MFSLDGALSPQRDEIFKQQVNDCVQHIILQKFTNFHAIRSRNFRIFAMRWWPRFCATLHVGMLTRTEGYRIRVRVRVGVMVRVRASLSFFTVKPRAYFCYINLH